MPLTKRANSYCNLLAPGTFTGSAYLRAAIRLHQSWPCVYQTAPVSAEGGPPVGRSLNMKAELKRVKALRARGAMAAALLALAAPVLPGASFASQVEGGLASGPERSALAPVEGPADPVAYFADLELGRRLLEVRDYAAAEPVYERLTRAYPLDRRNWSGLGAVKRQLGRCGEAIVAYRRSIELTGPEPGQALYWIAACHVRLGNREAALEAVRELIASGELNRPGLLDDPEFAALAGDEAFRALVRPAAPAGISRDEGWRGDLDHMMSEISRLHPRLPGAQLPQATRDAYHALRAEIPRLSDLQVYARMAQIVGTLGWNHTLFGNMNMEPVPGQRVADAYLPLRFYAFPDGLYVVDALDGTRDLVGARLVSIDGRPAEEAYRAVASALSAGSDWEIRWTGPRRLSELHLLAGLGIARSPESARLTFRLRDGRTVERTIAARADMPLSAKLVAPPAVETPLFLQRVAESHWFEPLPGGNALYAQVNQITPDQDETLEQFSLRLRSALRDRAVRNLILDLRHNNGGNTFSYVELLRTLIAFSAVEGNRLYVLIGRNVYSAAANLATELERLGAPVFVGEPTGNTGNQEGDEARILLPFSRIRVNVGGVWWQLSNPWDLRRSIPPHVPVALSAADYFAGRDPVLATTLRLIGKQRQSR